MKGQSSESRLLLDVLSADQFTQSHVDLLTKSASGFERPHFTAAARAELRRSHVIKDIKDMLPEEADGQLSDILLELTADRLLEYNYMRLGRLAAYFWFDEASTRTVGSFNAARTQLGMARLGFTNTKDTSQAAKGETFEDSMRVANAQLKNFGGGVVIMRTKKEGQPAVAAEILEVPVINAGDGQNEHPTQALLDIYTIKKRLGRLDGLNVVLGGDPRYGRTIHSLAKLLALYPDNKLTFVGDDVDWLEGSDTKKLLDERGIDYEATTELDPLADADVIYWTRLQTERMNLKWLKRRKLEAYGRKYAITEEKLDIIPKNAIIMHPLPRGPEMPVSIDNDPRVAYWDQVENSVPVRAALIEMVMRHLLILRYRDVR